MSMGKLVRRCSETVAVRIWHEKMVVQKLVEQAAHTHTQELEREVR
jgi:hypothetical protein